MKSLITFLGIVPMPKYLYDDNMVNNYYAQRTWTCMSCSQHQHIAAQIYELQYQEYEQWDIIKGLGVRKRYATYFLKLSS